MNKNSLIGIIAVIIVLAVGGYVITSKKSNQQSAELPKVTIAMVTFPGYAPLYVAKEKGFTRRFGDEQAKVGILSWGSTEGPIEEAIRKANQLGYEVAALQVKMLHPLPDEEIRNFLSSVQQVIVPELNFTGQFNQIIRAKYLIPTIRLNKCAGMPFTPEEILNKIEEVITKT